MNQSATSQGKEESFEITITNGAAKMLRELMNHYHVDSTKEILSMSLSLLNSVKGGEVTVQKPNGSTVRLTIPFPKNEPEQEGNT